MRRAFFSIKHSLGVHSRQMELYWTTRLHYSSAVCSSACFEIYSECRKAITLLPSQVRGTMILAELPNSLAIAVISDTWRVERLFNNIPLPTCFIILLYNLLQLNTFRLVVPTRLYKYIMAVGSFPAITVNHARYRHQPLLSGLFG
jgi:hypothetical protein